MPPDSKCSMLLVLRSEHDLPMDGSHLPKLLPPCLGSGVVSGDNYTVSCCPEILNWVYSQKFGFCRHGSCQLSVLKTLLSAGEGHSARDMILKQQGSQLRLRQQRRHAVRYTGSTASNS